MSYLGKCQFSSSANFLIWLLVFPILSCMSSLCVFHINHSWIYHCEHLFFSPLSILVFCFANGFLPCSKILSLILSHLLIFAFIPLALGDRSKKNILLRPMSKCTVCFLLRLLWFQVLHFIFNWFYWTYRYFQVLYLHVESIPL